MKTWSQLTETGRARRLRKLALNALAHYKLDIKKVQLLEVATNTLFKVTCHNGTHYALRVCTPDEHSNHDAEVEIAWLNVLNQQTDLPVPVPIANKAGNFLTFASSEGVPEERRCVLFEWVAGRPIDENLTPEIYQKLGATMAQMHDFAATFFHQPNAWPKAMRPMRWDTVFYYPDEPVIIHADEYAHLFPQTRRDLITQAITCVEPVLKNLYASPNDAIIIHGDLHMWNVHHAKGQLHLLDFEDLMWGYPIQDVAITLWYGREREDYAELRKAFKTGYSSVRAWPAPDEETAEKQVEALAIARTIMFINYAARVLNDEPEEYIHRQCAKLEAYLNSVG